MTKSLPISVLINRMKELEIELLATNKEIEEYKALAKYNHKRFKDHLANCQCSRKMKELEVALKKKDDKLAECKKLMDKSAKMARQSGIRINRLESK